MILLNALKMIKLLKNRRNILTYCVKFSIIGAVPLEEIHSAMGKVGGILRSVKNKLLKSKKNFLIGSGILCLAAVILMFYAYIYWISDSLKKSIDSNMHEIANLSAENVKNIIDGQFQVLNSYAETIEDKDISDRNSLMDIFKSAVNKSNFERVGLIYPDGTGIGFDFESGILPESSYSDREYFTSALNGTPYISEALDDIWSDNTGLVLSVPLYDNTGKIAAVVVGSSRSDIFSGILDNYVCNGSGYIHIINSDGDMIIRSSRSDLKHETVNIFDDEYTKTYNFDTMRENFKKNQGGAAGFCQPNGKEKYVVYEPVGVQDWYIGVILPASYLQGQRNTMLYASIAVISLAIAVIALMVWLILRLWRRSQRTLLNALSADPLTGIRNRGALVSVLKSSESYYKGDYALVIYNIKNFSLFNSIFGYEKGDQTLCDIAAVFQENCSGKELTARMNQERFALVFNYENDVQIKERITELYGKINSSVNLSNIQYDLISQCSICHLTPERAVEECNQLLEEVENVLAHQPNISENTVIFYDDAYISRLHYADRISSQISSALRGGEFVPYFQAKYDISGASPVLCGAEALSRWISPTMGQVYPDTFIPLCEKNGMITKLDLSMLEQTCIFIRKSMDEGYSCVPVSVNMSRLNLYQEDYIQKAEKIIDSYGVPHELIEFEMTESVIFENKELMLERILDLRKKDFKIALDDFGSGYSSFPLLKEVPLDVVKMDRTFFGDSLSTISGRKIVTAMLRMLASLNYEIVAEGIETENEVQFLKKHGGKIVQGYIFSKPLPVEEFVRKHLRTLSS